MMRNSKISWTDDTWNVTSGCSREMAEGAITSGCGDPTGGGCYAEAMAYRFSGPGQWDEGLVRMTPHGARWTGVVRLEPARLDYPLRWRGDRLIFVCSTSDPFHPKLKNEEIAAIYGAMAATGGRHIFQMLTKRARRRRDWMMWVAREAASCNAGAGMTPAAFCFAQTQKYSDSPKFREGKAVDAALSASWPLPNVWEGTSVEHQPAANDRIPDLLETPAALRWLSIEPMIGGVDLRDVAVLRHDAAGATTCRHEPWRLDSLRGVLHCPFCGVFERQPLGRIGWVVAGCESGHNARAADIEWFRSLRDQCAAARVPFFLKQAMHTPGEYVEGTSATLLIGADTLSRTKGARVRDGQPQLVELPYLDGRVHAEIPGRHVIASAPGATITPATWG